MDLDNLMNIISIIIKNQIVIGLDICGESDFIKVKDGFSKFFVLSDKDQLLVGHAEFNKDNLKNIICKIIGLFALKCDVTYLVKFVDLFKAFFCATLKFRIISVLYDLLIDSGWNNDFIIIP